jgi:hypothetical protein
MNGFEAMLIVTNLRQLHAFEKSRQQTEDDYYARHDPRRLGRLPAVALLAMVVVAAALGVISP